MRKANGRGDRAAGAHCVADDRLQAGHEARRHPLMGGSEVSWDQRTARRMARQATVPGRPATARVDRREAPSATWGTRSGPQPLSRRATPSPARTSGLRSR